MKTQPSPARTDKRKIRYAVVGLGNIAQVAVLPAFAHASENSELVALISSDTEKQRVLAANPVSNTLATMRIWSRSFVIRKPTLSTSRYPMRCIASSPSAARVSAFTCCAKNRWQ